MWGAFFVFIGGQFLGLPPPLTKISGGAYAVNVCIECLNTAVYVDCQIDPVSSLCGLMCAIVVAITLI